MGQKKVVQAFERGEKMKRGLICLLTILVLGACIPVQRERPMVAKPPTKEAAFLLDYQKEGLKRRIQELRSLLEQGGLDQDQSLLAASVIRLYEDLLEGQRALRPLERELLRIIREMEGDYFERAKRERLEAKGVVTKFLDARDEIFELYLSGNYAGVIDRCVSLRDRYGPRALGPQLESILSFSLSKEGLLEEAIEIGERVVKSTEPLPNTTLLMARIATWYLDLGQRENAIRSLQRLNKLLSDSSAHARRIEGRLAAISPHEVLPPKDETLEKGAKTGQPTTLEAAIQRAYGLAEEKKFDDAREYLLKRREQFQDISKREAIDQALKVIDQREEEYLDSRIAALSRDRFTLENAKSLAEEERYDEAISALSQLLAVSPENKEAKMLYHSIVEKEINKQRNKAAHLFLAAKNVSDPVKRERYLRSCLEILKGIVDKYPSSPLISKVNSHIEKVLKELEGLQ